jgi:phage terminase large subunit
LVLRKTRESLTESALVTFEAHVLPPGHPALGGVRQRRVRQSYQYPNGSEVVVGGMDRPTRIMSTEYDAAFVQEAIELTEGEWEAVSSRLRHGRLPYQQLLADTNPDRPTHWLKRRCDSGRCRLVETRHEDNPVLWDARAGAWTPRGAAYVSRLDALTGPRKQRLRYGRWVQAEGVVYDGWDAARHLLPRGHELLRGGGPGGVPAGWERFLSIDFGYNHPFVCQWWALDPEGRVYLYRELVWTGRLVQDHARRILALSDREPRWRAVVCDHDSENRAVLERHLGVRTVAAFKDVESGVQAVAARLKPGPDGRPRLFVLRDALDRRDPGMDEKKLPIGFVEEVDGYVWDLDHSRRHGERPVDKDNHSMDAARYLVAHLDLKPRPKLELR